MHLSRLGEVCQRYKDQNRHHHRARGYAQGVCDLLIENGILPSGTCTQASERTGRYSGAEHENMAASLALLCKHLNERMQGQDG